MADDSEVLSRISSLVAEEKDLRTRRENGTVDASGEIARLREVEVQLDQCWDLLRQRRARTEYGEDPDDATVRPPGEVEGYLG